MEKHQVKINLNAEAKGTLELLALLFNGNESAAIRAAIKYTFKAKQEEVQKVYRERYEGLFTHNHPLSAPESPHSGI